MADSGAFVVRTSVVLRWIHAAAVTVCPFIFIDTDLDGQIEQSILKHEYVHFRQQILFGIIGAVCGTVLWILVSVYTDSVAVLAVGLGSIGGWIAGQLLWYILYLLCLPVWYNPFRRKWETDAYRAQGFSDEDIDSMLKKPPYYLR